MSNPEKQGNGKAKKFQGYRTNTYIHTPFVFIYLFWAFWHLGSGRSASVGVCEFMAKAPFQRKSKEKRLRCAHANTVGNKGSLLIEQATFLDGPDFLGLSRCTVRDIIW